MFETSALLLLKALLINIIVPLLPWLLLLRLLCNDKFQGVKLYILSWFLGIGLIANWMFDLQFIHFGIGIWEYLGLLAVLIIGIGIKIQQWKLSTQQITHSLKIPKVIWLSSLYRSSSKVEKILTVAGAVFVWRFIVNSFVHTTQFPTYADDAFGNWHKPAINIYHDGWAKIFGEETEILGRGRLGYPIHIPIYKAVITDFMGWRNDIYINLFQRIGLVMIVVLSRVLTFEKTKNILTSLVPSILICWLPLVFWHSIEGYNDLPSVYYAIMTIRLLYSFLESNDMTDLVLWSFFLRFLSYIKNDWFVVYMPSIVISFWLILLFKSQLKQVWNQFINNKKIIWLLLGGIVFLLLPFWGIKQYYNLGFNQAQWDASGLGISQTTHREIFSQFKLLFFQENNYNLVLIAIGFALLVAYQLYLGSNKKQDNWNTLFLVACPLIMFIIFTLVFLVTENYKFVLDQTTVNRTYTCVFMILCFYFWILYAHHASQTNNPKNK